VFKAKSSVAATLGIGAHTFKLHRALASFRVAVVPGRVPLLLRLRVTADRITTPFADVIAR
jgi:hypothetical protein